MQHLTVESAPDFKSAKDECRYWKEIAKKYNKECQDLKREYEDYSVQSSELVAEIDEIIDENQRKIKDIKMRVWFLENENEALKEKFEKQRAELVNLEQQLECINTLCICKERRLSNN